MTFKRGRSPRYCVASHVRRCVPVEKNIRASGDALAASSRGNWFRVVIGEFWILYIYISNIYNLVMTRCFCGSTAEPKPRLGTPHSCANPCSRHRVCGHPCSLACHPGPCPPCQISTQLPCYCGKQIQSFRCSHLAPGSIKANLSCSKKCGKKLGCGNHTCHDLCHAGDCQPCAVIDIVRCYCGKGERNVTCGEGEEKECAVNGTDGTVEKWTGRFQCENNCERSDRLVHVAS